MFSERGDVTAPDCSGLIDDRRRESDDFCGWTRSSVMKIPRQAESQASMFDGEGGSSCD